MEYTCLECSSTFKFRKTMANHVKTIHGFDWLQYLKKHGQSETKRCHCGKEFQNNRYPGGPNTHGRKQKHCSPRCVQIATGCRSYGITPETYWEHAKRGCAICGRHPRDGERKLHIDHDHITGVFRGVLCHECNVGRVGANTIDTAKRVLEYLTRSRT